ncbi:hypothetical protein B7463_g6702, partial [Scytalidium lignicola]
MADTTNKNANANAEISEMAIPARLSTAREFLDVLEEPKEPKDPNVVDFEGPDDPDNAMNWPGRKKFLNILVVSLITLLSPIASTISSAAAADIMVYFHSTNDSLGAFVTTVFLLGYTFGPIIIAPLSEMYGRALLYKICMVFFIVFNVACAVANSLGSLIVFRLLTGIMGSCPVTLGAGSIADMIPAERRAGAMAAYIIGVILGPSIGPICGGYLSPAAGWRWEFWLMAIAAGVVTVPVMFMNETYSYVILERKTERLRKERGNPDLRSALNTGKTPRQLFVFSILRPLKMLISPIIFLLSLYTAVVYSYLYLCFTTFPGVFSTKYGFGTGAAGLVTLGYGIGSVLGLFVCGATSDRLSKYLTQKYGGETKPEYRLPIMVLGGFLTPIGLFWYGWTAEAATHWIVPIIGTSFIGGGMIITYMASTMYLVDAYTVFSASVTAASTIFRCLFGALLPLAGPAMSILAHASVEEADNWKNTLGRLALPYFWIILSYNKDSLFNRMSKTTKRLAVPRPFVSGLWQDRDETEAVETMDTISQEGPSYMIDFGCTIPFIEVLEIIEREFKAVKNHKYIDPKVKGHYETAYKCLKKCLRIRDPLCDILLMIVLTYTSFTDTPALPIRSWNFEAGERKDFAYLAVTLTTRMLWFLYPRSFLWEDGEASYYVPEMTKKLEHKGINNWILLKLGWVKCKYYNRRKTPQNSELWLWPRDELLERRTKMFSQMDDAFTFIEGVFGTK